jgi:hypothetical protein
VVFLVPAFFVVVMKAFKIPAGSLLAPTSPALTIRTASATPALNRPRRSLTMRATVLSGHAGLLLAGCSFTLTAARPATCLGAVA